MDLKTERDFIGYGGRPPHAAWPGNARIAIQFVLNYEEGGERSVTDGDAHAETFLSEIIGANPYPARHMSMESMYEYGARAGFWRIHRLFREYDLPVTVYGVAVALARNPDVVEAMLNADWDIACHGYRWLDFNSLKRQSSERTSSKPSNCIPRSWDPNPLAGTRDETAPTRVA